MCKPWKVNGFATEREEGEKFADHKRRQFIAQELQQYFKLPVSEQQEIGQ
jgi:hypothetical protein